jgi:hypothetical protein
MMVLFSLVALGMINSCYTMSTSPLASSSSMGSILVSTKELVMSKADKQSVCNKLNSRTFSSCIKTHFPIGSDYFSLKAQLLKDGFILAKGDEEKNRFYFIWSANNMANYKVVVLGGFDEYHRITQLKILP